VADRRPRLPKIARSVLKIPRFVLKVAQLSWLTDAQGSPHASYNHTLCSKNSTLCSKTSTPGTLLVDEVIKLEELDAKWPAVSARFCLAKPVAVSQKNAVPHRHYSFYYDDASVEIVRSYMQLDIATFGYEFERAVQQE
jgi:hypothetical protein